MSLKAIQSGKTARKRLASVVRTETKTKTLANQMFGLNDLSIQWATEYDKLKSDMYDSFVCNTLALCNQWQTVYDDESSPTPRKIDNEHGEEYLISHGYLSDQQDSCFEQLFDSQALQRF